MSESERTDPPAQADQAPVGDVRAGDAPAGNVQVGPVLTGDVPAPEGGGAGAGPALVYCRCAYARVVPLKVKDGVLEALAASGVDFDAAPDLCEMSARRDPRLKEIAGAGPVKIAACYPRAVRWLFNDAGSPLDKSQVTILNMREQTAEEVAQAMLNGDSGPEMETEENE